MPRDDVGYLLELGFTRSQALQMQAELDQFTVGLTRQQAAVRIRSMIEGYLDKRFSRPVVNLIPPNDFERT